MTLDEPQVCVQRGGRLLPKIELEAHLASLLRLEHVGAFLGAGASVGLPGGKTMQDLWNDYNSEFPETVAWLARENFLPATSDVNIEALLDSLALAEVEARRRGESVADINSAHLSLKRTVVAGALLQEDWWCNPSSIDLGASELDPHRRLLLKLVSTRMPGQPAPWIFTTNYDLAIEWAAETLGLYVANGFSGLHRRTFSPHNFDLGFRNTLARGEARFGTYNVYLAKLHGSLSWHLEDGQLHEASCAHLWPLLNGFLQNDVDDGPGVIIYPSGAKHLETASFELGELVRRFSEFVARPQSGLIISGYSFSDQHVNRILLGSLQNPTLQLVIYYPQAEQQGDRLIATDGNPFVSRLLALESPQISIVGGGHQAYFDQLVDHIPDPVVYDQQAADIRSLLRELKGASVPPPPDGSESLADSPMAAGAYPGTDDDEDIPF